jgi:peroxiredoxin
MKNFFLFLTITVVMLACACKGKNGGQFAVAGDYKNASKLFPASADGKITGKIFLVEVSFGKDQSPAAVDSTIVTGDAGSIHLSAAAPKEGIYELVFGDNLLAVPLVNDATEIRLVIDLSKKDDFYQASGSPATASLQSFISDFGKKNYLVVQDFAAIDSLKKANATDSTVLMAINAKNTDIQQLNDFLKHFLSTSKDGTVSSIVLGWASRSFSQQDFEASLNESVKKFPASEPLLKMKRDYDAQKAQAQQPQQQPGAASWIGQQAPDLNLPDVNGKSISLSSFKGKYLLVDFWASWCGPCRAENPNVVKAYSEFKDKNFAILGVSLDKDKDAWQQAVKEDGLAWAQVSDLKYWNSKAVEIFKFEGIPFNVLIDPQGKIIEQELRGPELENKLRKVLQ